MAMRWIASGAVVLSMFCVRAQGALTGEEKAFFDQHLSEVVKIEPTRLASAPVKKVFAAPFYEVNIEIKEGDGTETSKVIAVRMGGQLVSASRPGSDTDLPDFPKMINPTFKLNSDADAKVMQAALDTVYPLITDDEKKGEKFKHVNNQWIFVRGPFFDREMGFILQVDATGTITSAKYMLKLP